MGAEQAGKSTRGERLLISLSHAPVYDMQLIVNIDGRPWFAKLSISDVQQVEIAAIDPDFDRGHGLCP